jgi:hypothetical protein
VRARRQAPPDVPVNRGQGTHGDAGVRRGPLEEQQLVVCAGEVVRDGAHLPEQCHVGVHMRGRRIACKRDVAGAWDVKPTPATDRTECDQCIHCLERWLQERGGSTRRLRPDHSGSAAAAGDRRSRKSVHYHALAHGKARDVTKPDRIKGRLESPCDEGCPAALRAMFL